MSPSSAKAKIDGALDGAQEGKGEGERESLPASAQEDTLFKADHGDPTAKRSNHEPHLDTSVQSAYTSSSDTLSGFLTTFPTNNEDERCTGRLPTVPSCGHLLPTSSLPSPRTWRETFRLFWARNRGMILVMLAQIFGVMMNVAIRLLEMSKESGPGMHPFQVRLDVFLVLYRTLILSLPMPDPICSNDRHSFL